MTNQLLRIMETVFNMPLQAAITRKARSTRRIGFNEDEITSCSDFFMNAILNIFETASSIGTPTEHGSTDTTPAYRKVCREIAKVIQPVQIQPKASPPRLSCHEIIGATDFTRRMVGIIKENETGSMNSRMARQCISNLHALEDDWLSSAEASNSHTTMEHVWFDVMCFSPQKEGESDITRINLLATLSFIKKKFNLCHISCVSCCKDSLYIIAPACEIVIISKCMVPFLQLIVPLHKPQLPKSTFLCTPLIIDALSAAPPRSLMLKWSMFCIFSMLHRTASDPVDFMFDELVSRGCPVRAEAARWRLLALCNHYISTQRAYDKETDPYHHRVCDYTDYIPDDAESGDTEHAIYEDTSDDEEDTMSDSDNFHAERITRRKERAMRYQRELGEIMCRIKDMTRAADTSIDWSITTADMDILARIDTDGHSMGTSWVFKMLNESAHGDRAHSIVADSTILRPCVTHCTSTVQTLHDDSRSMNSSELDSPRSISNDGTTARDTEGIENDSRSAGSLPKSTSGASEYSITLSGQDVKHAVIPRNLATNVLCEIAHHPEISQQQVSMRIAASLPTQLRRKNHHEDAVYERIRDNNFENTASLIARKEYRKLYSPSGGGSRSRPVSIQVVERTRHALSMMKQASPPTDLDARSLQSIQHRWVHRNRERHAGLDYTEQAFHLEAHMGWENMERIFIEYEEALRGFAPGSHGVHGIHDVRKVRINTKRSVARKKRRRVRADLLQRGGAHCWASENVDLCVSIKSTGAESFPLCAKTALATKSIDLLKQQSKLRLITEAYGHVIQPGKLLFPDSDKQREYPLGSVAPVP